MLAVPMWLLYELGIFVAAFTSKKSEPTIQPPA